MGIYEKLLVEADKHGVAIIEKHFKSKAKGLLKGTRIGISKSLKTSVEKACVLAEELGHYHTTVGDIIDQSKIQNRKQERQARAWAYYKLVPFDGFIEAYEAGITGNHDLAEFLDITEEFLQEAITYYYEKYGLYVEIDNYIIYFEPLGVMKLFG